MYHLEELSDVPFHATASVFVLRPRNGGLEVLLVHHSKFQRWMIPGGHVEVGEEPWMAAEREVLEETGLAIQILSGGLTPDVGKLEEMILAPAPAWVAIEDIRASNGVLDHRHIDYLFVGVPVDNRTTLALGERLRWFSAADPPAADMFAGTSRLLGYLANIQLERFRGKLQQRESSAYLRIAPMTIRGEQDVAKKTIFVSDLTGSEIDEKNAATVTIRYADARRGQVVLDVNASEVDDLAARGQKQARRGRRPKESGS